MPYRLSFSTLAIAGACSLLLAAPLAARDLDPVRPLMSARELCDNLRQISLRRLAPVSAIPDRKDVHDRMHSRGSAIAADAPVVISVLVGGGMAARGPAGLESVIAWRDPGGTWYAQRSEEPAAGEYLEPGLPLAPLWPDPQPIPLVKGNIAPPGGLRLSGGLLPVQDGLALDRALAAESCLDLEPADFPASLLLRGGGRAPCVADSAWRHIELRQGRDVRRFFRPCQSVGPVGLIGQVLDGTVLPGAPSVGRRADLYNGTEAPTRSSLLAFLDAHLPNTVYRDETGDEHAVTAISHDAPCSSTLTLSRPDGSSRTVGIDWKQPRSFPVWIEDGVVRLGTGNKDPSWIAPGTVRALQLQGVLFSLAYLCSQ